MNKCDYYRVNTPTIGKPYGVCYGSKNAPICNCEGDTTRCTYYPTSNIHGVKFLNTAEMWMDAQKDGCMYECVEGDIAYSKSGGLVSKHDFKPWPLNSWKDDEFDVLMSQTGWIKVGPVLTIKEAEQKLGCRIVKDKE